MKPGKRSFGVGARRSQSYCLLCSDKCTSNYNGNTGKCLKKRARLVDFGVNIVGGEGCPELGNRLEKMFVLLKVLEVPREWCEQVLLQLEESDSGWFNVCGECTDKSLVRAWEICQKILALEGELASVKRDVREGMRDSIPGNVSCLVEGSVDYQIKKLLFPDLFIKSDPDETAEEDDDPFQSDDYLSDDDDPEFQSEVPKRWHSTKVKGSRATKRRKRCSGTRQLPKNLYRTRPHGVLKRKQFHWKICTACNSRYKSQEEYDAHLVAHQEIDGGEFSCPQCTFPARSLQELEFHQENRHEKPPQPPQKRTYICPRCPLKTDTWRHLKQHVEVEHPSATEEELTACGLILKCELCGGKQFGSLTNFYKHRNKAHPETVALEPLSCPDCDLKFLSEQHLQSHVRKTHRRQNRFICDQCGKGFQWQSELETHKVSHLDRSQKQQLICHLCGLDYVNKQLLNQHYAKCHPKTESSSSSSGKVFKCRYCDLTSHIAVVIKRHLETHKAEMGFKCEQCPKCYTSAQGLSRHVRINHSNESWQCPHCSKAFPCEEYLKDHIRKYCKLKRLENQDGNTLINSTD